jgi:hypothetical protein
MKLPGTHAAYAVLMAVFGQTCAGVHLGFLIVNCATIIFVFALARRLIGELAGPVAAATYALMSLSAGALATAAHATHFVVLFALAGLLLVKRAVTIGRLAAYGWSGALLGSSVLMKHNGLLFVAFAVIWLAALAFTSRLGPKRSLAKVGFAFFSGLAAPFLVLLLLLWLGHSLEDVWHWSVTYARAYARPNPGLALVWRMLMQRMPDVMQLPFYAGLAGLVALWLHRTSRRTALFATGFLLASLLAVVPGFHFRSHYYVLLMPALALLTGALVQRAAALIRGDPTSWFRGFAALLPVLLFASFWIKGIARERAFFFQLTPVEACRRLYESQPFPEALELARYLREHSPPDARIAVVGSEPEICFYAHRRSATGFIYTYPLAERQPLAESMKKQMFHEIETANPQFLVQVRSWTSWLIRPGPQKRIDEMCRELTPANYHLIGACEFSPDKPNSAWHWFSVAPAEPPGPEVELLVFERK